MQEQQPEWRRLSGERLRRPIEEEVNHVMTSERNAGHQLEVYIGTDSQVKGNAIDFATVIVFYRKGKGAFMFVQPQRLVRRFSLRERMLEEVHRSITTACALMPLFLQHGVTPEIHVDINTQAVFKSHTALSEATGYLRGMGFHFQTKPYAFASSSCADKMVQ
ncbi:hypothetical protein JMG10_00570 [Nostoc ellipsosporum NOK]|nr:hypothetical protein [Nostoc ellipsosporum NOK]